MSRSTGRHKAGLIFALVALVLGTTAGPALGWDDERSSSDRQNHQYGKHKSNDSGKGTGKGHVKDRPAPPEVTPPEVAPPPTPPAPPAPAPPVAPAQTPPQPEGEVDTGEEAEEESPVVAQQAPSSRAAAPLAPAAQREELAQTGLAPGLIALIGGLCLVGGGLLLRRSLVRE